MLALNTLTKAKTGSAKPDHHVIPAPHNQAESGWISYLASWAPSPARTRPALRKTDGIAGFRNPWPSWHKATLNELRESCQWGEPKDGCLELADSHLTGKPVPPKPDASRAPRFNDINDWPNSPGAKAARLLRVEDPDFSFSGTGRAKVTWLGHAGYLVQLPSLDAKNNRPVRCLFDPMFSSRASPSQLAGPIRSYPPPCKGEDLPQIDALFLSHNHYDHMDYDSIMAVWKRSGDVIRFFVPLGNKKWLVDWGITGDRVVEMDWWDAVQLSHPTSTSTHGIKIWCTPAQHNSWRSGTDADSALWSSWYLEHQTPNSNNNKPYRVFFAGDTGYQFHPSPSWPPSPNNPSPAAAAAAPTPSTNTTMSSSSPAPTSPSATLSTENDPFPTCPAFTEIRSRLGSPHLLLLPISVGATYDYVRSFVPLPDWVNPVPRLSQGVTAANHMPSWDAVRVLKVLTGRGNQDGDADGGDAGGGGDGGGGGEGKAGNTGEGDGEPAPVALAMHWGTFVTDPIEVPQTLGELEWACKAQGVRFGRALPGTGGNSGTCVGGESGGGAGETAPWFLALNHGQSVYV